MKLFIWFFFQETRQIFREGSKLFVTTVNNWKHFKRFQRLGKNCGAYYPSMAVVNSQRRGARYPSHGSNDDLKEDDHIFTTLCNGPMEDDSAPIIISLELFKQAVLIDTDKNGNNHDDCGEWNVIICCIKVLNLDKSLTEQFVGFTVHNKTLWV